MNKFIETAKKWALAAVALLCAQGASAATVAKIGETGYETLAAAVTASQAGDTISIVAADTYKLPGISKNVIVEGAVDGVVFDCTGTGNICAIPNGVTFKNATFNMGNNNYHGWQAPGAIALENCTINGLFFNYGDMTFTGCKFIQDTSNYHMWIYGSGLVTFTNCEFVNNKTSKFFNLYCEGANMKHVVVFDKCSFKNNGTASKSAINVKATCGNVPLDYVLVVNECTSEGVKCKDSASDELAILDDIIQVDDRKASVASKVAVAEGTGITVDENGKILSGTITAQYNDEDADSVLATGVELAANGDGTYTASVNPDLAYVKIAEGFYQSAATYADSSDFYITNLAGLKYFRDVVNHAVTYYMDEAKTKAYDYTSNIFSGKTVHLLADIDLGGEEWEPIGNMELSSDGTTLPNKDKNSFNGNFDGGNHTIKNLVVTKYIPTDTKKYCPGLFGYIKTPGQVFKDLTIENAKIRGYDYSGALIGNAGSKQISIINCHITGAIDIAGTYDAGGFVGIGICDFTDCSVEGAEGSTIAGSSAGGLAACAARTATATIDNCTVKNVTIISEVEDGTAGAFAAYTGGSGANELVVKNSTVADTTVSAAKGRASATVSNGVLAESSANNSLTDNVTLVSAPVAKDKAGVEYATLAEALAAVTAGNPLAEVLKAYAWPVATPVYYNGAFYTTLAAAIVAANEANADDAALIYVRPGYACGGKPFVGDHDNIKTSIAIYGNDASLGFSWEPCVEYTGTGYHTLTKDITFAIYNLHDGAGIWGVHYSAHVLTAIMENCNNAHEYMVNGGTGSDKSIANVTLRNCKFGTRGNVVVATTNPGEVLIEGCTFTENNNNYVVNINNKNGGVTTATVKDCTFNGGGAASKGIVRINGEVEGSVMSGTFDNLTFNDTTSALCDIQVGHASDASDNKAEVSYTITNTAGSYKIYTTGTAELKNADETALVAANTYSGSNIANPVAKLNNVYYSSFEAALAAVGAGDNTLTLLADTTWSYPARSAYGTAETTSLTVIGDLANRERVLTLHQTNTDWSSLGLKNADAVLKFENLTINKTTVGGNGAWNNHDIIFTAKTELTDLTINNGIALENSSKISKVDVVENGAHYAIWITADVDSVSIEDSTITATNGGRGIKIGDQYVTADKLKNVELSIKDTVFETAKKSAVLVTTTAGATITTENVDISKVAADDKNVAWVDEDRALYFSTITVNGNAAYPEGGEEEYIAARVTDDGKVISYYKKGSTDASALSSFAQAVKDAYTGGNVVLFGDITGDWDMNTTAHAYNDGSKDLSIEGKTKADGTKPVWTVTKITSGGNGDNVLGNAENLTVKNIKIILPEGCKGFGLKSGTIEDVDFVGGDFGVILGGNTSEADGVYVHNCTFTGQTWRHVIYTEGDAWNYVVEGCTFTDTEGTTALFNNGKFINNTVVSTEDYEALPGVGLAIVSADAVVTGNIISGGHGIEIYSDLEAGAIAENYLDDVTIATDNEIDLSHNYWGEDGVPGDLAANIIVEDYYETLTETADGFDLSDLTILSSVSVGTLQYNDLDTAVSAAQSGDTLVVLRNIKAKTVATFPAGKELTLDLNGKKIGGAIANGPIVDVLAGAKLTILDSKEGGEISNTYTAKVDKKENAVNNAGSLVIESGKFSAGNVDGYVIRTLDGGDTLVKGGTFVQTDYALKGIFQTKGGKLVIDNATVDAQFRYYLIELRGGASVTVNGGDYKVVKRASESNGTGNQIFCLTTDEPTASADIANDNILTINGGTFVFDNEIEKELFVFGKADASLDYTAQLYINGGTFIGPQYGKALVWSHVQTDYSKAQIVISGGTLSSDPSLKGSYGGYGTTAWDYTTTDGAALAEGCVAEAISDGSGNTLYTVGEAVARVKVGDTTATYNNLASALNAGKARGTVVTLLKDVDLNNEEWTPVGNGSDPFCGTFDGAGHTISNLKVSGGLDNNAANNYRGLIGRMNSPAVVKNLTIHNADVSGSLYVGAFAGMAYTGKIENCHLTGKIDIRGWWYMGGITGYAYASIYDSSVTGDEGAKIYSVDNSGSYVGGIVGFRGEGKTVVTENCSVDGVAIVGNDRVGGISGQGHYGNVYKDCTVKNTTITISDRSNCGTIGLITGSNNGTVDNPLTIQGAVIENTSAYDAEEQVYNISGNYFNGAEAGALYAGTGTQDDPYLVVSTASLNYHKAQAEKGVEYAENSLLLLCDIVGELQFLPSNFYDAINLNDHELSALFGSGTAEDPYGIYNLTTLKFLRDAVNADGTEKKFAGKYFKQMADIDLGGTMPEEKSASLNAPRRAPGAIRLAADDETSESWEPIGTKVAPFEGVYDGNGKTVSNLYINDDTLDYAGLFGYINRGTASPAVGNIVVSNVNITAKSCVGGFVGTATPSVMLEKVTVTGIISITGNYKVGGIAGGEYFRANDCHVIGDGTGTITGVYKEANLEGDNVGGFAGFHAEGAYTIADCSVSGVTVTGTRKVGGFFGSAFANNNITGVEVSDVTVATAATAEYATEEAGKMGIGGLVGLIVKGTPAATFSGVIKDVTIGELPEGVSFAEGNVNYGLVTGGLYGGLADPAEFIGDYSALFAYGYDAEKYSNDYLLNLTKKAAVTTAEGVTTSYETLADALEVLASGGTLTLLDAFDEVANTSRVTIALPAGATFNGNGKTLTGYYTVVVDPAGATVENVDFSGIVAYTRGKLNEKTAVTVIEVDGGEELTGKLTVENCSFKNVNNVNATAAAIKVIPANGAEVEIVGNTFEQGEKYAMSNFVLVQSDGAADFTATVTDNTFAGEAKAVALTVATFTDAEKIVVDGNAFDDPLNAIIQGYADNANVNYGGLLYPLSDGNGGEIEQPAFGNTDNGQTKALFHNSLATLVARSESKKNDIIRMYGDVDDFSEAVAPVRTGIVLDGQNGTLAATGAWSLKDLELRNITIKATGGEYTDEGAHLSAVTLGDNTVLDVSAVATADSKFGKEVTIAENANVTIKLGESVVAGQTVISGLTVPESATITVERPDSLFWQIAENSLVLVQCPVYVTVNGGDATWYSTLAEAVSAVNALSSGDILIGLVAGTINEGTVTINQVQNTNKKIAFRGEIDEEGNLLTTIANSAIEISPSSVSTAYMSQAQEAITFENILFDASGVESSLYCIYSSKKNYHALNITVDNCKFVGNAENLVVAALQFQHVHNLAIKNVEVVDCHSALQISSFGEGISVSDTTVTNCKNGFSLRTSGAVWGTENTAIEFANTVIDVANYGIRIDGNSYDRDISYTGGSIKAEQPIVVRNAKSGNKTTVVTVSEETEITATGTFPWFSATSGDDGTELAAPTSTTIKVTAPGQTDDPAILAAKSGDTWYWPAAAAIADAEEDDIEITLLRDNAENLTLATGKTLAIVKDGHVYTGTVSPEADVVLEETEDDDAYYYNAACVAQITAGETTTKYASLAMALAAAENGQTVVLIDDVTPRSTLEVFATEKAVTLDLAGKTIAANAVNPVFNVTKGELILADSSATAENETGSGYIATVENGTAFSVAEDAKLSITGGIVSGDITGDGTVDITGGYFLDEVPYDRINTAYVRKGDKVEINGVEYYTVTAGSYVAILYRNDQLVDKYETIKAAVESSTASGDIVRLVSNVAHETENSIALTGKDVILDLNGKTVSGSEVVTLGFTGDGSISITNGTISATGETRGLKMTDGAKVELCGGMAVNSANLIGIVAQNEGTKLTIGDKVEVSGGTYGISVAYSAEVVAGNELKVTALANHAINAASGAAVAIGDDATINAARHGINAYDATTVTVGENAKISVGGRGTQVYNSDTSLAESSKLTIGKNASIVSYGDYAVSVFAGGEVTVGEAGDETVIRTDAATKYAVYNAGTFTLNGGSLSVADTTFGKVAVNNGTFNFNGGKLELAGDAFMTGIENGNGAVLNIAGGELRVAENAGAFAYIAKLFGNASVNVTGGLIELLASTSIAIGAENTSSGSINISGGKFRIYHEGGNGMAATAINNLAGASVAISGDAEFELADQSSTILNNNGTGTIDITGGTFKSVNTSTSPGGTVINVSGSSSGNINIDGCDVDLSATYAVFVNHLGSGNIAIAGGKFKYGQAIGNHNTGKIGITGGEFETTSAVASLNTTGSALEISGGTFRTTNGNMFSAFSGSSLKISDGVFTLTKTGTASSSDGLFANYGGTVAVSGGEFTVISETEVPILNSSASGTLVISGGHFWVPVETLQCAEGCLPYKDPASQWYAENTERTVDIPYTVSAGIVAQVTLSDGTVAYYTSIAEAFEHVEDGATVALLKDTSAAETVELFDEDITVTLDFAGKMVTTSAEPLFDVTLGKLILLDNSAAANGGITGDADKAVLAVADGASLAVSGGWYSKVILDAWCGEGYIPNKTADATSGLYTVKSSDGYIAKVFYAEGGEPDYFQELYDATDVAVNDGDTVVILADCDLNDGLLIDHSITLKGVDKEDGARVKLTGSARWNNDGNVLIYDDTRDEGAEPLKVVLANIEFAGFGKDTRSAEGNSVIDAAFVNEEAGLLVSNCAFTAYNHTAVTVDGGTFEIVDSDFDGATARTGNNTGNGAIYVASAQGVLDGVAIANLEGEIAALFVDGGTVAVTNSTITAANGVEVYSDELDTTVALRDGTIVNAGESGSAVYAEYPAIVTIDGGEYTGAIYGANDYTDDAVVKVSGGYISDDLSVFDVDNWTELTGGFYKTIPAAEYCASGYIAIANTGADAAEWPYTVAQISARNETTGEVYGTLQSAIDAASANDVITVLADISGENVTVATDGAITVTSELGEDGKALWTIDDTSLTITGADTELTLVNLKFTGSSYVHAQNGAALTVDSIEAIVDPVNITGRSAFIVPGGNGTENNRSAQGLAVTVKNSTIVNTCGTDYYGAAIFGWRFLSSVEIANNTFGSEENRSRFVTVKLMNATDGAVFNLSGNKVYGTNESYGYYAFDLYQNNSRANSFTVYSQDNIVDAIDGGVNDLYVFDIERSGTAASAVVLLDNGTTLNGEPIVIDDILLEITDELFTGFHGVEANWDENGKLLAGGVYNRALTGEELATYAVDGLYSKALDEDTYTLAGLVARVVTKDAEGEDVINNFDTLQSAVDFVDELAADDEPVITVLASDVAEEDIPEGWFVQTADGVTTLVRRKALVVIPAETEGGAATTNVYSSFVAALAAANDGDTVVLLDNVTMANALTIAKNIDLDLNECTLKLANAANNYIREGYDVTIANGTIDFNDVRVNGDCIIGVGGYGKGAATLTLDAVEMVGKDYSSAYAVLYVYENSTLNIKNSTLEFENELSAPGGAIKGTSTATSTINIEGSTLEFTDALRGITTGVVNVKDSTIAIVGTGDGTGSLDNGINAVALTLEDSDVTISGGTGRGITVRGGLDTIVKGDSKLTISDMAEGDIMFQSDNTLAAYDTSVVSAGTVVLTTGTTKLVEELLVAVDDTAEVRTFAAQIGRVPYDTFAAAYAAVQDGEVIHLLADVEDTLVLGEGESVTIDHNGYDLTVEAAEGLALLTSGEDPVTYSTGVAVAKVIDGETEKLFASFEAALVEANSGSGLTVQLLADATTDATGVAYTISKDMTIDGNGKTISTSKASKLFEVKDAATDVTFKDIALVNSTAYGRCVDTRKDNVELKLAAVELVATGYQSQPLTIGGADAENIVVNITDSKLDAGTSGYAVVTFNTVNMTVTGSELNGYAAFYLKGKNGSEGSAGSKITIVDSKLTTSNSYTYDSQSSFALIVMEDDDIEVNVEKTAIVINTSNTAKQGVVSAPGSIGNSVTIDADSTIALNGETSLVLFNYAPYTSSVQVQGETLKAQLEAEGWTTAGVADKEGWFTIVAFIGFDSYDGISEDKTDEIIEWLTEKQDALRELDLDEETIAEEKGVAAYIFDDVSLADADDISGVCDLGIAAIAVESDTKLAVKLYLATGADEKVAYTGKLNGLVTLKGKTADGEEFAASEDVDKLSEVEFTEGKTDWLEFTVPAGWAIVNPAIVLE